MSFGIIEKADITPKALTGINLPIPGEHNIYNALAAVAVAKILKIKNNSIKKGLETFCPSTNRTEIINLKDGTKIINDTYNANPQSMAAALKLLSEVTAVAGPTSTTPCRRIAVLGDMLELGKKAKAAHQKVLKLAEKIKVDKIFTFGRLWPRAESDKKALIKKLKAYIGPRDIILVKGSRGMKMEEVVGALI